MNLLKRVDSLLNKAEGAVLVLFLSVMVVMAFLQVVLRNGFNATILWVDILLRHLVLWAGFLGAALATSGERHINIDALTRFLSPRIKSLVAALSSAFAAVTCWLLLRASITFLQNEIVGGSFIYAEVPSWYSEIVIPSGFGLLMFHFSIRTAVNIDEARRGGVTK